MKGKIWFFVSVIFLAGSAAFAWQRVKADETARQLQPEVFAVSELISENDFLDIEEYREFIIRSNEAMKKRKYSCRQLLEKAKALKEEIPFRMKQLEMAGKTEEMYEGLTRQLSGIPEIVQEAEKFQSQLDSLREALEQKNGEEAELYSKEIRKAVVNLSTKLKTETEGMLIQLSAADRNLFQNDAKLFELWVQDTQASYENQDYVNAYSMGKLALKWKKYADGQTLGSACLSGGTFAGETGKVFLTFPVNTPDMEGKIENLYVMERTSDGTAEKRRVTGIHKSAVSPNVNFSMLTHSESMYGNWMMGATVPWEFMTSEQQMEDSPYGDEDIQFAELESSGLYDILYEGIEKAAEWGEDGGDIVLLAATQGTLGSSLHTYEDVVQLAQSNQVQVYIMANESDVEDIGSIKNLSEETGGFFIGSDADETYLWKEIYGSVNRRYEIDYETSLSETEPRNIEILLAEDRAYVDSYSCFPKLKSSLNP